MKRTVMLSTLSAITALGLATAPSAVATTTQKTEEHQCAAVHLVLVNGTFDSAPGLDQSADSGFYAGVAVPALQRANEGTIRDKSAGIQAPEVEGLEPELLDSEGPATGGIDSESLWESAPTESNDAWGPVPTPSAPSAAESGMGDAAWPVSTTAPDVVEGTTMAAPTTSVSSQWPGEEKDQAEKSEDSIQRLARTYISYPASAGGAYIPGVHKPPNADSTSYADSMATGVESTKQVLSQIAAECPTTKPFLSGYSQGAQVVSTVLRDIGAGSGPIAPSKIAGGVLLSDPTRATNAPLIAAGGVSPEPAPGTRGTAVRALGALGTKEIVEGGGIAFDESVAEATGFGALNGRVASYCLTGDLVCAMPGQSPLPKLVTSVAEEINLTDPIGSLRAVAESLGPAVVLGGVETVADDLSFGEDGFEISRASNTNDTLLGRIATEAQAEREPGEMEQRLLSSAAEIGGMALGAGITIARKTLTPENLALIAAAGVAGPQAAAAVAVGKLAETSFELITPDLAGGATRRVLDEVQAAGLDEQALAGIATDTAQWNAHASYGSAPVTPDGRTAMEATTDYAVALAADAVSGTDQSMPRERVSTTQGTAREASFNQQAASNAMAEILEVAQQS
ncbi:cutinase family protein [Corynebacterium sp. A21]|uniref:cutinase family protein n=1 Tax=Corynebacterium sp. A21 TaxID=3457318 RepID=UPI003FD40D2D